MRCEVWLILYFVFFVLYIVKKLLLVLFFNLFVVTLFAAPKREFIHREAEKVYFPVGKSQLNWDFGNNDVALQNMVSSMLNHALDSTIQLRTILIQGNASPEGSVELNKKIRSEEHTSELQSLQ